MTLIDRLRPKWKHSDPEVRASTVREVGKEHQDLLRAVVEQDDDARVRRLALKKIDDPDFLMNVAEGDQSEELRALAAERAAGILMAHASSDADVSSCDDALRRLTDMKRIVAVCIGAAHASIRKTALDRLTDDRALGEVARSGTDPAIRQGALERISDGSVLRSVALADGPSALLLEAVERIDDPESLWSLTTERSASKAVRQKAEARLGELIDDDHAIRVRERHQRRLDVCAEVEALAHEISGDEVALRVGAAREQWQRLSREGERDEALEARFEETCRAMLDEVEREARREAARVRWNQDLRENLDARRQLCERVESLEGQDAEKALRDARIEWMHLGPVIEDEGEAISQRFMRACSDCEERIDSWHQDDAFLSRAKSVIDEFERLADSPNPAAAGDDWRALEKRWRKLQASSAAGELGEEMEALRQRFASAGEKRETRQREREAADQQKREKHLAEVTALCGWLEELAREERLSLKVADEALRTAAAAQRELGPLPPSESRRVWKARLADARQQLFLRFQDQKQNESWRRWASADLREKLVQRTEALREVTDLPRVAKELRRIQEEWRQLGPPSRSEPAGLADRYRKASAELRQRVDEFFGENLKKKEALCEEVESLAESTDWNKTADRIKQIQATWKEIGPVAQRDSQVIWQRFRKPCDQFFERRSAHFDQLKSERAENAAKKVALCERVEALADSTEWERVTQEIKDIQAEWKTIGAAPRKDSEALWQRFRKACDHFFDRRSRRGELELEAKLEGAEQVCAELEAAAAAVGSDTAKSDEEVGECLERAWSEWRRIAGFQVRKAKELRERLRKACEQVGGAYPEGLKRVEPEENAKKREKLCVRFERLVGGLGEKEVEKKPGNLAEQLKQAMAANTFVDSRRRRQNDWRTLEPEVERLKASWERMGPTVGDAAQALAARIERAYAKFMSLRPADARGRGGSRNGPRREPRRPAASARDESSDQSSKDASKTS